MGRTELERLQALADYAVLDTEPEEAFDRLTALAADLFDAPMALVSLVDAERQWFKSRRGIDASETPRSVSFCAHAIQQEPWSTMVVPDATADARFQANPFVVEDPKVRFYTGAVLTSRSGHNLGTLCVVDTKVRPAPSPESLRRLSLLAQMVVDELELRRVTRLARERGDLLAMAEGIAGLGHWRLNARTRELLWSDQMYRIYGLRQGQPLSFEDMLAMTHPEDAAAQREAIEGQLANGEGTQFAVRIVHPSGAIRHLSGNRAVQRDDTGQVIALIGTVMDVTAQRTAELTLAGERERLAHQAQHDALTGLPNRSLLHDRVTQACHAGLRDGRSFALAYLDLDGFKAVNDTLGHAAGDELLRQMAERLTSGLRDSDTVCRLGGDEFVILMRDVASTHAAAVVAADLAARVALPCNLGDTEARVSASVGVAMFPQDALDPEGLMRHADSAMYRAKKAGKNQVRLFRELEPSPAE